jgi:hypothetical protein
MFAAQTEGFEKTLADRGHVNPEFPHSVVDDGGTDRGMLGSLVLNDLQGANARALLASSAQEQAAVARGPEGDRACGREVGFGIEVLGDSDGVLEHRRVDLIAGIDIDAAVELNEVSGLRPVVAAGLIDGLADEVKGHFELSRT